MQFYDLLKHQSLFLGMSSDDYSNVIAFMHFGFETLSRYNVIASPQMPCKRLLMLTSGYVDVDTVSQDGKLHVHEHFEAPMTIEPERLFGMSQHYSHTYKAASRCGILSLSKGDVLKLMEKNLVFRINILNYLATISQRQQDSCWQMMPMSNEQKIWKFFMQHVVNWEGEKVFRIRMIDLAAYLGMTRLDLSKVLNNLDSRGKIVLQRGMITIPGFV